VGGTATFSGIAARHDPVLLVACVVLLALMAFLAVKRLGGSSEATARAFARAQLARLADAEGWEVDAAGACIRDRRRGIELRLVDPAYDYEPGGTALELTGASCGTTFAVWTREPPDSAVARWGPEVPTGDEIFDARFTLLTREPREAWSGVLGKEARSALLGLQTPSLVTDGGRLVLLLAGVPDGDAFTRAIAALSIVSRAARRQA
jgi:hypothetical protein